MHVLLLWWWRGRGGDGGESNLLQTGGTSWGNQNAVLHSPRVRLRDCRTSAFCDTQSLIHQLFLLLLLLLLLFPHLPWCNGHGWLGVKKQFSSFLPSPLPPPPPQLPFLWGTVIDSCQHIFRHFLFLPVRDKRNLINRITASVTHKYKIR